jgi:hypothetical protein
MQRYKFQPGQRPWVVPIGTEVIITSGHAAGITGIVGGYMEGKVSCITRLIVDYLLPGGVHLHTVVWPWEVNRDDILPVEGGRLEKVKV